MRVETQVNLDDNTKEVYYYDTQSRLVKKIEYDGQGVLLRTFESFYDNNGLEYATKLDGAYTERMKYDNHKNLIWMEWYPRFRDYRPDPAKKYTRAVTVMEYVYDYRGNWIEMRQFRDGVYNLLQTRMIEYID